MTVIALDTFPAIGALDRRRVPAPVLKQNGALTFFNALAHFLPQWTRKQATAFIPHIHKCDSGHWAIVDALWQYERTEFLRLCIVMRFQRRSCRPQHNGQLLQMGAHHSDIASIVSRCGVVLFIRTIVLFVDNDKTQILDRRKNS